MNLENHKKDENGKFVCRYCGQSYKRILNHVLSTHQITHDEYMNLPEWPGIKDMEKAQNGVDEELLEVDEIFGKEERYVNFGAARIFSFGKINGLEDISKEYWNEEALNYIPNFDPTFIPDQNTLEMIALGAQMNIPTYCYGPTGSGKSSSLYHLASIVKMPIRRVNLHGDTRASDLMGTREVVKDDEGTAITKFVPGIVTKCMENGWWLMLDEMDCAKTGIVMVLQSILERTQGKKRIFVPNYGVVNVHPLFRIFGTGNTNGRGEYMELYPGTQILNEAFMDRFALATRVDYNWDVIKKAVPKRVPGVDKFIPSMIKVAIEIEKAFTNDLCFFTLSPRKVFTWAEVLRSYQPAYKDAALEKSASVVIASKLGIEDAAFFEEIFHKVTGRKLPKK
jgi:MoxR-like ATPase